MQSLNSSFLKHLSPHAPRVHTPFFLKYCKLPSPHHLHPHPGIHRPPQSSSFMADVQYQYKQQQQPTAGSILPRDGPSASSQILAVVILLPIGGILLFLAGITLAGSLIGLAVATPLLVIFSPILVPAVIAIGLAVSGFITSGAFGITALSSFSWIFNYMRRMKASMPPPSEQVEPGKR